MVASLLAGAAGGTGSLPPISGGDAGPSSAEGSVVSFGSPFSVGSNSRASGTTSAARAPELNPITARPQHRVSAGGGGGFALGSPATLAAVAVGAAALWLAVR